MYENTFCARYVSPSPTIFGRYFTVIEFNNVILERYVSVVCHVANCDQTVQDRRIVSNRNVGVETSIGSTFDPVVTHQVRVELGGGRGVLRN